MKKLYKVESKKMICGVCAGIAEYFEIDVSIVRLIMVILALLNGIGILLYIAACIILPSKEHPEKEAGKLSFNEKLAVGILLILIGAAVISMSIVPAHLLITTWLIILGGGLIIAGVWLLQKKL